MTQPESTVHLGLGSNMGDRLAALRQTVHYLDEHSHISVTKVSGIYETGPWGLLDQPDFFNIAVEIETAFTPIELLNAVKALEKLMGRQAGVQWGPRVIDIDLILWGDVMMQTPRLTLPHKHFRDRRFVLAPLAEIAPEAVDPETGETVAALLLRAAPQPVTRCVEVIYS